MDPWLPSMRTSASCSCSAWTRAASDWKPACGRAFFVAAFFAAGLRTLAMRSSVGRGPLRVTPGVARPPYRPGERGSAEGWMQQLLQEERDDPGLHHHREQHAVAGTPQVRAVVDVVATMAVHPDRIEHVEHGVQDRRHRQEEHEDQRP